MACMYRVIISASALCRHAASGEGVSGCARTRRIRIGIRDEWGTASAQRRSRRTRDRRAPQRYRRVAVASVAQPAVAIALTALLSPLPGPLRVIPRQNLLRIIERSTKLFDKGESRHQIQKAPAIIIFAAPQNHTSIPQLKLPRFVELHDLAVQRNVQSSGRDRDLNEVRVCSLVCYRLADTQGAVLERFHVHAPITHGCFTETILTFRRRPGATAVARAGAPRTTVTARLARVLDDSM